jgi:hypothetical protein
VYSGILVYEFRLPLFSLFLCYHTINAQMISYKHMKYYLLDILFRAYHKYIITEYHIRSHQSCPFVCASPAPRPIVPKYGIEITQICLLVTQCWSVSEFNRKWLDFIASEMQKEGLDLNNEENLDSYLNTKFM